MFLGREWKCPQCGTLNKTRYSSYDNCRSCGFEARSYTQWLRLLFGRYRNTYMVFEVASHWKKGRRRFRNSKVEGYFQTIKHDLNNGFVMEFLVRRVDGRRTKMHHMNFFLIDIVPWGRELYNVIYNPEVLRSRLVSREALPEAFNQITSPEAQLVIS